MLKVITDYTYALDTLDRYDYQSLEIDYTTKEDTFIATYDNAMEAIKILRDKFGSGGLFANEKTNRLKVPSIRFIKRLEELIYIRVLKRKQPCYSIS